MEGDQPAWATFTGQSYEEYQAGMSKAVHPKTCKPTVDEWKRAVAESRKLCVEHRLRRADGIYRRLPSAPCHTGYHGNDSRWVGVHVDVTEKARARGCVAGQRGRMRTLASALPQMVWVAHPSGAIDLRESAMGRLRRSAAAEAWKEGPWIDLLHPEDRASYIDK